MIKAALLVGIGGFIGSILRYLVGSVLLNFANVVRFPLTTIIVNVVGCSVIGYLSATTLVNNQPLRLFLFSGILGGFTTFSAFGLEILELERVGQRGTAVIYLILSVVLALAGAWTGRALARGF